MNIQINENRIKEFFAAPFNHGFIVVTNSKGRGYCSPALVFWNGSKLTMIGNRYGKSDTNPGAIPSNLIATDADEFNAYAFANCLVHIHGVTTANGEEQEVYKVLLNLFHKLKNSTANSVESLAAVVELVTYGKWKYVPVEVTETIAEAVVETAGVAGTEKAVRDAGHGALWTAQVISLFQIEGIRGETENQKKKATKVLAAVTKELGLSDPRQIFA